MREELTEEEIAVLRELIADLQVEHRELDEIIHRLTQETLIEELKIKRLKKRKLKLKDHISRLENKLIPDILA